MFQFLYTLQVLSPIRIVVIRITLKKRLKHKRSDSDIFLFHPTHEIESFVLKNLYLNIKHDLCLFLY